jgi:hypothetical protein
MAVGIANTGTFGFADTVAVVEDGLSNDLVLEESTKPSIVTKKLFSIFQ